MGKTGNEIPGFREAGDHPPGRAIAPAGAANAGRAGGPAWDVLPLYDRFRSGGPEALEDRSSRPRQVWNRIPDDVREQVLQLALDEPELSPRELAARFTDTRK